VLRRAALGGSFPGQVPVQEREKILKKEGLDPSRLTNLTLVYKVQEVRASRLLSLPFHSGLYHATPLRGAGPAGEQY
jgi:hypothetical protein